MNIDDMLIVKNLVKDINKDLTKEESNLIDRIDTILEFDKVQESYNESRKAFESKMAELSKKEKAGE